MKQKLLATILCLASSGGALAQHWLDAPLLITEPGSGEAYGVGDHDGDGNADILQLEGALFPLQWNSFRVLLGDGAGAFTSGPAQPFPGSAHAPLKAPLVDVTGDGRAEIFFLRGPPLGNALVVFPGAASGGVGAPIVLDLPGYLASVVFGDHDNDGVMEMATLHDATPFIDSDHVIRWWDWDGAAFLPSAALLLPDAGFGDGGVAGIATLDVNGDGRSDLVAGESQGSDLFLLPTVGGAPTLGPAIALPHALVRPLGGDLDADGDDDVVVIAGSAPLRVIPLVQNAPLGFTVGAASEMPFSHSSGGVPRWLVDWDKDGHVDLLSMPAQGSAGSIEPELLLIRNDGANGFTVAAKVLTGKGVSGGRDGGGPADFDGDGCADFAAVNTVAFGNGRFEDVLPLIGGTPVGGYPTMPLDWEDDGDIDLVRNALSGFPFGGGALLLNDAAATFTAGPAPPPAPAQWGPVSAVGNFDGVPGADLLVPLNEVINPFLPPQFVHMRLIANDGFGNLIDKGIASSLAFTPDSSVFLPTADVDGDGDLDVLDLVAPDGGYWPNQGDGTFGAFQVLFGGEPARTFDADADGDLDVLVRILAPPQLVLFRMDGPQSFTPVPILAGTQVAADAVETFDLDADGDLDLVVGRGFDGSNAVIRLFRNDGTTSFAHVTSLVSEKLADERFGRTDVDGDGIADLLSARAPEQGFGDRLLVHRGLGGGFAYAPPVRFAAREMSGFIDLDQDGDVDGFGQRKVECRRFDGNDAGVIRQYGFSSSGTGGAKPVLGGTGPVRPGSTTASIRIRLARGGAPVLFFVGTSATQVNHFGVPGFTLFVNPPLVIVPLMLAGPAGAAGQGTLDVNTSALIALVPGLAFHHQLAVIDPQAQSGVAFTNGLEIRYGL